MADRNLDGASVPAQIRQPWWAVGVMLCGLIPVARAEDSDLRAEIEALRVQIAELRARRQELWLTQRRAEHIRALVHEVLADSETRASFGGDGITAGWDRHFYLASDDGTFYMQVKGYLQTRYLALLRHHTTADERKLGFQMRRAKVAFEGQVLDPKFHYAVQLAADRDGGEIVLENAYARYEWLANHHVQVGQFKARFNREELVSATRQQAMERSTVNGFFRLGYVQAAQVSGQYDRWNWAVAIHDGREAQNLDFRADHTDIAIAGRVEMLAAGRWEQFAQYAAGSTSPPGVLLGAGMDYELAESGSGAELLFDDFWQWTADASVQVKPVNVFLAAFGRHTNGAARIGGDFDQFGTVVQAGFFIIPDRLDLFARWEWLDHGGFGEVKSSPRVSSLGRLDADLSDEIHLFTFGTNYYFQKQAVKITLDVVWAPEGVRQDDSGAGLLSSDTDGDTVVARAQFQLLF
jgi:hypothetical protein